MLAKRFSEHGTASLSSFRDTGNGATRASNLLTGITDPRGLQTHIDYLSGPVMLAPYGVTVNAVVAYLVKDSGGIDHYFQVSSYIPSSMPTMWVPNLYQTAFADYVGTTQLRLSGLIKIFDPVNALFSVRMIDDLSNDLGSGSTTTEIVGPTAWMKTYDAYTEDLVEEIHGINSVMSHDLSASRQLTLATARRWKTDQINQYNFMGNPLSQTVNEYEDYGSGGYTATNSTTTGYAYWGPDKYFQQMAVKDPAGRLSATSGRHVLVVVLMNNRGIENG